VRLPYRQIGQSPPADLAGDDDDFSQSEDIYPSKRLISLSMGNSEFRMGEVLCSIILMKVFFYFT